MCVHCDPLERRVKQTPCFNEAQEGGGWVPTSTSHPGQVSFCPKANLG